MTFPIVPDLLSSLFKKPNTNPFPAPQLPPTVTGLLDEVNQGKAELNPPVPAPERLRGKHHAGAIQTELSVTRANPAEEHCRP